MLHIENIICFNYQVEQLTFEDEKLLNEKDFEQHITEKSTQIFEVIKSKSVKEQVNNKKTQVLAKQERELNEKVKECQKSLDAMRKQLVNELPKLIKRDNVGMEEPKRNLKFVLGSQIAATTVNSQLRQVWTELVEHKNDVVKLGGSPLKSKK